MKTYNITFVFEKSTKNTHKFTRAGGGPCIVGELYIQKWACPTGVGPGTKVQATFNIAEGGTDKLPTAP